MKMTMAATKAPISGRAEHVGRQVDSWTRFEASAGAPAEGCF